MKLSFIAIPILTLLSFLHGEKIPVLIIDGQNNHDWISTTDSLHATLQATQRFAVEIETAPQTKSIKGIRAPKSDAQDYIKEAYKSFRKVQQEAENKNKVSEGAEWEKWNPFQGKHQAIVLNYNGREWTQRPRKRL